MDKQAASGAMDTVLPLKDPVCGMTVTEQSEQHHEYSGKRYYFCSAGCKTKFKADPENYSLAKLDGIEKKCLQQR